MGCGLQTDRKRKRWNGAIQGGTTTWWRTPETASPSEIENCAVRDVTGLARDDVRRRQVRVGVLTGKSMDDFEKLIGEIEEEAREEGPGAVREWEDLRSEFRIASQSIALCGSHAARQSGK